MSKAGVASETGLGACRQTGYSHPIPKGGIGGSPRFAAYSGAFRLYVRLRKVLGTGTTQMFNPRLSFEIRAD